MKPYLLIFIDGLGIPPEKNNFLYNYSGIKKLLENSIPIDAVMGVEGRPQSGTGQTSLFCGVNAQKIINRHHYAYPDSKLRKIIKEQNIFKKSKEKGKKVCFANAYSGNYFKNTKLRRSVTTWMNCYSNSTFLLEEDLVEGNAVFHDITNQTYPFSSNKLIITPLKAAENLMKISQNFDLTVYEYFITDRIGHGKISEEHLNILSDFLDYIMIDSEEKINLIITSDHGNIEDKTTKQHTLNKIPLYLNFKVEKHIKSLSEVAEIIL